MVRFRRPPDSAGKAFAVGRATVEVRALRKREVKLA